MKSVGPEQRSLNRGLYIFAAHFAYNILSPLDPKGILVIEVVNDESVYHPPKSYPVLCKLCSVIDGAVIVYDAGLLGLFVPLFST